jgi:hypothetical protein
MAISRPLRCDHNQTSQKPCQTTEKLSNFYNIFMQCHFNVMLIKEIYTMNVE